MEDSYRSQVIKPGEIASKLGYEMSLATLGYCKAIEIVLDNRPEWQKEIGFVFKPYINERMNLRVDTPGGCKPLMWQIPTTDGGGHKPEIHAAIGTEEAMEEAGHDLVIMNDHDILRRGGKPCYMTNFYDAKAITEENVHLLHAYFRGLGNAMREAQIANLTGESAVVKYAVTAFCDQGLNSQLLMNIAGTCIGIAHVDKYLDGSEIKSNMPIVGLVEKGGRCNGFTRLIDIVLAYYGSSFRSYQEAVDLLRDLSIRSQSYSKTIQRIHGWMSDGNIAPPLAKIVGMYHITGGGIWDKLSLPPNIGAFLSDMPQPPESLLKLQKISWDIPRLKITDRQAHGTFNGGLGYIAILKTDIDAGIFIEECKKDGKAASVIGRTTASLDNEIIINSKFKEGKALSSLGE